MVVRYLLDTNTVSYVIKGNFPLVRKRLIEIPMSEVGISVITEAELRFGVAKFPNSIKLSVAVEELLRRLESLPWDSAAAKYYAVLRTTLEKRGEPMGNMDMMIAAQALAVGATLVISDRVFARVRGLRIEDWSKN